MTTSIIVADSQIARDGLRCVLQRRKDFEIVADVDGDELIACVVERQPDVVVLELALRGVSAVRAIRAITGRAPRTRCVVLSDLQNGAQVRQALEAGAKGYVVKAAGSDELFAAIDAALADRVYLSPEIALHAIAEIARGERAPSGLFGALSPREREVMELVCQGQSTREVARRLDIATKTVDSHRYSLMKKVGARRVSELVRLAIREGVVAA